jgi:predicted N-acetyltransferase YhbS
LRRSYSHLGSDVYDAKGFSATNPVQIGFRRGGVIFRARSRRLNDLSLLILPEQPDDGPAIERLYERTFGPGRYARTAYRLREANDHRRELSFTARIGTLLVGSVRLTPVLIGDEPALLLGPLTIEPPFRNRGIGRALIEASLEAARNGGAKLVLLVGDEPYYGRLGFKKVERKRVELPGPVDRDRVLIAELQADAFEGVAGAVRPDFGIA